MNLEQLGAAASTVARMGADILDWTEPGWFWEAKPEALAEYGAPAGSSYAAEELELYSVALQAEWGEQVVRRQAVSRKLRELEERGARKLSPEEYTEEDAA